MNDKVKSPKRWTRMVLILLSGLAATFIFIIALCNHLIVKNAEGKLYSDVRLVPYNEVGLLLGTSPWLRNGNENKYFTYRIEAAVQLYNAGKIRYILISGDNRNLNYNEPRMMRRALTRRGVPGDLIFLDFAGFRTLDSVVRAKKVFGLDNCTIISQRFHNERAIYIADYTGLDAIGFDAKDVSAYRGMKTRARELLARVKVFIDRITNKQPHFLGEPEKVGK